MLAMANTPSDIRVLGDDALLRGTPNGAGEDLVLFRASEATEHYRMDSLDEGVQREEEVRNPRASACGGGLYVRGRLPCSHIDLVSGTSAIAR